MFTLDSATQEAPLDGLNLRGRTLGEQLSDTPTLLVFLRHLGCLFCREMVKDLRVAAQRPGYPAVLLFFQGTVDEGSGFLERLWPGVAAVADPGRRFYRAFGLERGTLGQLFSPGVVACGVRAVLKGNGVGLPVGDPWQMPGLFLVHDGRVVWQHDFEHAGDHPDFSRLPFPTGVPAP